VSAKASPRAPVLQDPIMFEVLKNGLISAADEMAVTVVRTAHSQVLRDNLDFSTAICDGRGRLVAQGLCLPLHLGAIPEAMDAVLERYEGNIEPGDVFIHNDPLEGGMHLPDIFMFKPIFCGGHRVGFAASVAHYPDIGGRAPGGNAVDSTEIYAEGLQIPILKLFEAGRANETLLSIITKNVRIPEQVLGDLMAQRAACLIGERRFLKLVERYSLEGVERIIDEILDHTEYMVRSELRRIPDGRYSFTDHIDDDGFGSDPIPISVTLTVAGDELLADFEGSSPQVRSALNSTTSYTKSAVYIAVKCIVDQEIPSNHGFYRPIEVRIPAGTILNALHPAPRAARGLTGFRTVDTVFGALHQAVPGRVWAAGDGGNTMIAIGGTRADRKPFVFVDFESGAWGARPSIDGVDGTSTVGANMANVPVEEIELHQPVRVGAYGFVPDTGGAGVWRGGLSIVRELQFLEAEGTLQIRSDRRAFRPYGLGGGGDGSQSLNVLNPGPGEQVLPTKVTMGIRRGDVLRHLTAGGGGFGDPFKRDPALVLVDYVNGKVSAEHARQAYGVVVDESEAVDVDATRQLRAERDGVG
jgi:N-methylhydantoinase B